MDKSPPPDAAFNVIGVRLDLRPLPEREAKVSVTAKRIMSLQVAINDILSRRLLSSGIAASLCGKLGFTITATFGRVGRAKIRPIMRRAYSKITALSMNLECCLRWWLVYLRNYSPRPVPTSLHTLPTIISYSDGEGGRAGVGVAAWVPGLQFHPHLRNCS